MLVIKQDRSHNSSVLQQKKLKLIDFSIAFMIIANIAFYDKTPVVILAQIICIILTIINPKTNYAHVLKYIFWWYGFILFCLLSYFWAQYTETFITCMIAITQVALIGSAIVIYVNSQPNWEFIIRLLILGGAILCIRMVIVVPSYAWGTNRVGNYVGYGNDGAAIVLSYIALFSFWVGQTKKKNIYYILSLLFIFITLFTGSKKGLFIILIGICILIILSSKKRKSSIYKLLFIGIFLGIIYYIVMKVPLFYNIIGHRIEDLMIVLKGGNDYKYSLSSSAERMLHIKYAFKIFLTHPFIGVGLDVYRYINPIRVTYAHNNYLELMADLGIIGTILYYIMPIYILKHLFKKIAAFDKRYNLQFAVIICIFVMDIGLVSYSDETIHIIFAVICGYIFNSRYFLDNK